ncbi:hypothetical protein HDU91_007053, partial [Kappamyces sp. JEL0680]
MDQDFTGDSEADRLLPPSRGVDIERPMVAPIKTKPSTRTLKPGPVSGLTDRHSWSPLATTEEVVSSRPMSLAPQLAQLDSGEHGLRWRYDDYTTIDWIHDTIKEKVRLRSIKKGSLVGKYWDASQAWVVLSIVGLASGSLAALMDITIPLLESVREGYCTSNLVSTAAFCPAGQWIEFSGVMAVVIYVFLSLVYALLAFYIVS